MTIISIADLSDERLEPYRHLRTTNLTRYSGRFIAESKPLVARLLKSTLKTESVLVDEKFLEEAKQWIPEHTTILAVPSDGVSELIGFHFHRGYLACGLRPANREFEHVERSSQWTGAMMVGVQDPENMGSIFRTCAALGISDIVIGPECVDPFARRVLRVSMGNAFKLQLHECGQTEPFLDAIHESGIRTAAACLAPGSIELCDYRRSAPTMILFGNEAHGLPQSIVEQTSDPIKIDMNLGTDSLNVSVAAGIILHYICRLA